MHTVKIISVYVHILPKPHIVLYILNENEKGVVLYFEGNEKVVVFDIIFLWLLIFFIKQKRGNAICYNILFNCNVCSTYYVRSLNYIFAAIDMFFHENKKSQCV